MTAWFREMWEWITAYYGSIWVAAPAAAAYVYLFFAEKENRRRFVYPCVLIAFLVMNPVLYHYVYTKIIYWRLLWLLPNAFAIAYAVVLFAQRRKHIWVRTLVLAAAAAMVILGGTNVYTHAGMTKAANDQKVSETVQNVCDVMLGLEESPHVIASPELGSEIRQYAGEIQTMYGRNAYGYINTLDDLSQRIANELCMDAPNYEYIFGQAVAKNYDFVVAAESKPVAQEILDTYGYVQVGTTDGYCVYYCADVTTRTLGGWIITQYGPNSGKSTCYTIEDEDNNLIIIDGGYGWYEGKLRAIIRAHDNHVTAWIVSSYTDSNAHAFSKILQDKQGITIDRIYTFAITDEQYEQYAAETVDWQTPEVVKEVREALQGESGVQYVQENDSFEELGLTFRVLHVWDQATDDVHAIQEYDGSMCFTVEGKEETFLYLSKITPYLESYLVDGHAQDLDADYVQLNNNGEWIFSEYFYDLVSPEYVFMDCNSERIAKETEDGYDTRRYYEKLSANSTPVGTYEMVPNWIVLK